MRRRSASRAPGDCLEVGKDCASGTISGITFEHSAANPPNDVEYAVYVHGSAVQMRACRVRNSGSFGISCEDGDKSLIEDCEIVGSHDSGLRVKGAGTAPTFRNNRVHGSSWSGIAFVEGAGGLAEKNTCEDNTQYGFLVSGKGTAPTLTGNTARHNGLSGFILSGGSGRGPHRTTRPRKTRNSASALLIKAPRRRSPATRCSAISSADSPTRAGRAAPRRTTRSRTIPRPGFAPPKQGHRRRCPTIRSTATA